MGVFAFRFLFVFSFVLVVLLVYLFTAKTFAAPGINDVINFQGKLANSDGTNVADGLYDFVIRLYDGAGSSANVLFTENFTHAALWTSTMSSAPSSGGESLVYISNTNESSLFVGQILWNVTKQESVIVTSVNTVSNTLGISPTRQAWNTSDVVTNRVYVKDGIFRLQINSVNRNWGSVNFNTDNLFVGLTVGTDNEMRPRFQLSTTPYAQNADRLDGLDSTSFLRSDANTVYTTGTFTFHSGTSLVLNGDLSIADTHIVFNGVSTNLAITGDFAINTDDFYINKASGLIGINTVSPDRRLDILDTAQPQLRLTYTDGTVYTDFGTNSNGNLTIRTSGTTGSIILQANGVSTAGVIQIGAGGSGSTTPDIFALDVKSDSADPSNAQNGYMYYNAALDRFRCYEAGQWRDCITSPTGVVPDSLDFTSFEDTLDLDSSLVLNQGSYTWTQNYSGTAGAGYTYIASGALTSGNAAFDVAVTSSSTTIPGLLIRYAGTGAALVISDDGTASDLTPVIVDALGNLGVGTVTPHELLTVGGSANRGDIALFGDLQLQGMSRFESLTGIIDTYIYDTSRDVDGGAWTDNRTASWYLEPKDDGPGDACVILTDDRCGDSAFPSKAILAVTADGLYIFDAKDARLWMKFTQAGSFALGPDANNNPSSVFALNGVVYVATNGSSATGLYAFDFVSDRLLRYNTTHRVQGDKNIAQRNTVVSYSLHPITSVALIDNVVNDVHGAVISGSSTVITHSGPLQGVTLIAVATDSSVSVINVSQSSILHYSDQTGNDYNAVYLTKRARLYALNETLAQLERWDTVDTDNVNEINGTPNRVYDELAANRPNLAPSVPTILVAPDALEVVERASFADDAADIIYVGTSLGLTEIHDVNAPSTTSIGWSKFYNSSRVTGYMSGNTRGHFLFHESSGSLLDSSIHNNVLAPRVPPTYGVSGVNGAALSFNGSSQFLCSDANNDGVCDSDPDYNNGTISFHVELWFRHSVGTSGEDVLVSKLHDATGAATAGWVIWMNSSGQMRFAIDDDSTWTLSTAAFDDVTTVTGQGARSYADGQWHHLVAVNTDTALHLFIDGILVGSDTSLSATATLDASQILTVGATCAAANCSSGANFWTGEIDDLHIAGNGNTTSDTLSQAAIRRRFLAGREMLAHRTVSVTDATIFSSNTIGHSSQSWVPNDFVGKIVEITGGMGAGQTRKVVSNTSTTLTVHPPWTITPNASSDFIINSERLYGGTSSVFAVGAEDSNFLGVQRKLYVGTNSGTDTGGVSVMTGMANLLFDVYHIDAGFSDDLGTVWSDDDISAVDYKSSLAAISTNNSLFAEYRNWNLQTKIDEIQNTLAKVRAELVADGLHGVSSEVGQLGGADLAEYFDSDSPLEVGTIVAARKDRVAFVEPSSVAYQSNIIGVVATQPGLILGSRSDTSTPVALAGRVPVLVTDQNGFVQAGDYITSSDTPGFGMRAVFGRVIGIALEDADDTNAVTCPAGVVDRQCHRVVMLVNAFFLAGMTDVASTRVTAEDLGLLADPTEISQFLSHTDHDTVLTVNRGLFENLTVSEEAFIRLLIVEQELRLGDTLIDKFGIRTQKLRVSDTAGRARLRQGESEVWVSVPSLSGSDMVLALPDNPKHSLRVDKKTDGLGFSVVVDRPAVEDISFQWWVVGLE